MMRTIMRTSSVALSALVVLLACGSKDVAKDRSSATAPVPPPAQAVPPLSADELSFQLETADLQGAEATRWAKLADTLQSPCGKPESLKHSLDTDKACARAPYAARYLALLIHSNVPDDQATQLWNARYHERATVPKFVLTDSPMVGKPDAPVAIVEFFDYTCPHCKLASPKIAGVVHAFGDDVVIYYKFFVLDPKSTGPHAAAAALAASLQGKFTAMHDQLFAGQGKQADDDIRRYAKFVGLDNARFEADWDSVKVHAKIEADSQEALDAGGDGTPLIFINGREYTDNPADPRLLADWVREELSVKGKAVVGAPKLK